ncbi:hypothetical protein MPER_05406 [Moniliophthora perniciosa FA553]|nr:hypothetical protein MPER_05406 [Moniliophthora perniciosa FA553]
MPLLFVKHCHLLSKIVLLQKMCFVIQTRKLSVRARLEVAPREEGDECGFDEYITSGSIVPSRVSSRRDLRELRDGELRKFKPISLPSPSPKRSIALNANQARNKGGRPPRLRRTDEGVGSTVYSLDEAALLVRNGDCDSVQEHEEECDDCDSVPGMTAPEGFDYHTVISSSEECESVEDGVICSDIEDVGDVSTDGGGELNQGADEADGVESVYSEEGSSNDGDDLEASVGEASYAQPALDEVHRPYVPEAGSGPASMPSNMWTSLRQVLPAVCEDDGHLPAASDGSGTDYTKKVSSGVRGIPIINRDPALWELRTKCHTTQVGFVFDDWLNDYSP